MKSLAALFKLVLCGFVLMNLTSITWGSGLSVFEKTYIRETQKPVVETDTFMESEPSGPFTLIVKNGRDGKNRVSSAIIKINGKRILSL